MSGAGMIWKRSARARSRRHSRERAITRYGLYLSNSDLAYIVREVRGGRATFVRDSPKDPKWCGIYRVTVRGVKILVVYDRGRHVILTVLPNRSKYADDLRAEAEWAGRPVPSL